jgi:hypothetical protein
MTYRVDVVNDLLSVLTAAGTLTAALAAAWAAWVANQQNKRLTERRLHLVSVDTPAGKELREIELVATNDSMRPITVRQVGLRSVDGQPVITTPLATGSTPLPVTLQDGSAGQWYFPFPAYLDAIVQHGPALQLFATDARGVTYTAWISGSLWQRTRLRVVRYRNARKLRRRVRDEVRGVHGRGRDQPPGGQ